MSQIQILPDEISNRIAAGEVIERPASVVKELLENAIDAGAAHIAVVTEKAGTKLIAVTDDGCGMDSDDALLCLEVHGTSKIRTAADIERIQTLGFRGEALPSIASVSRFRLKTRRKEDPYGTEVEVQGGKIIHSAPVGCAAGTEFRVRDLFFNTPARRKFLRSPATEDSYIQEVVLTAALAHPGVAFELTMDQRPIFNSPGDADIRTRLQSFFGRSYVEQMLPVAYSQDGIAVTGFVAMPGVTRSSRREQRTFVNGRPVDAPAVYRALRDGYDTLADRNRFAPALLFLRLDAGEFDINVHPAKREIRFRRDYVVSRVITAAVRSALGNAPMPQMELNGQIPMHAVVQAAEIGYEVDAPEQPPLPLHDDYLPPEPLVSPEPTSLSLLTDRPPTPLAVALKPTAEPEPEPPGEPYCPVNFKTADDPAEEYHIIGAVDDTYLLATRQRTLLIIDQHAAHERVLFEKLLRQNAERQAASQRLLLPIPVELGRQATAFLMKNRGYFAELGFELDELSSNTVMVNALPAVLGQVDAKSFLADLFGDLTTNGTLNRRSVMEGIARAACKAAVKAHDRLTREEMEALLRQLNCCERPDVCPHGRPTMIALTYAELERRFGRR